MSRVLSTPEAKQAVTKMQSIINEGLLTQIKDLNNQGQILCQPDKWDGALAGTFRQDWPTTHTALEKIRTDLEELRAKVQKINANIMTAGGNAE